MFMLFQSEIPLVCEVEGKGKVVPVLNEVPLLDVWWSGGIAPRILSPGIRLRRTVSFTPRSGRGGLKNPFL
jgi:hypothetical protein